MYFRHTQKVNCRKAAREATLECVAAKMHRFPAAFAKYLSPNGYWDFHCAPLGCARNENICEGVIEYVNARIGN